MNKILIIIPAYNEEGNIRKVLDDTRSSAPSFDLIVVNDASTDKTEEYAKEKSVNVISHPVNLGAGAAIQTGLKYANKMNYDYAVVVDGDGQHDPAEINGLLGAQKNNQADVVIGSRFLAKGRKKVSILRRIGIILFSIITSALCGAKITDTTSGFRVFNKKAIKYLSNEMPADFPDADMVLSLMFSGFKIVESPVSIRERPSGRSMYSALRSVYYPFKLFISIMAVCLRKIFRQRK